MPTLATHDHYVILIVAVTMALWTLHVDYSLPRTDARELAALADDVRVKLGDHWSVRDRPKSDRVTLARRVSGRTVSEAMRAGLQQLERVAPNTRLPADPTSVRMHPTRLPDYTPELLALVEVAGVLNVSRQRAQQLSRRSDFPKPVTRLATGPVYAVEEIESFLETWDRRPGRPARIDQRAAASVPLAAPMRARRGVAGPE